MKIVRILDEYRVIVDYGSDCGAKIDDRLAIIGPNKTVIEDPDTGEVLGTLQLEKAKLAIFQLYPKMCVCINEEKYNDSLSDFVNLYSKPRRLNVDVSQISGPTLTCIQICDPVIIIN